MTLRVHLSPGPDQVRDDNGVGRVIHAQYCYLPALGVELVDDPAAADVIAAHIQQGDLPRVDVLHVHGLYWTGDPGSGQYQAWHHEANRRILQAARRALAITVPSPWVAECFTRDMRITPTVIGHGIELADWAPAETPGAYILWNKNRAGDVCSPAAAEALARRGLPVVSTFGAGGKTMQITGVLPHAQMRAAVCGAGVYLATTKETFGIGTLEALAAGVPVLGYEWGGTAALVTHKVNGWLVAPGDIDGLAAGYAWLMEHRAEVGVAAQASAEQHGWLEVMRQYVALYQVVAERRAAERHRVSVVITNYNYGQYLQDAIDSAFVNQTDKPDEVILVDDASTDNSAWQIQNWTNGNRVMRAQWAEMGLSKPTGTAIRSIIHQQNQGVAAARNAGIAATTSEYIICLDADDVLAPEYVATCRRALAEDRGLGVAYTGLGYLAADGTIGPNVWTAAFDWERQATPANPPATTIHCAAMFRRSMWERAGGYQQVYAPGEDAEFWTRGLAVGYEARQVTTAPLFGYRAHEGSASRTKEYRPVDTWHPWMRDGQYPMAAPAARQPLVRSYSEPLISVVIPVGPGHQALLPAALDSLLGQTFRGWEVIVVLDGEHDPPTRLQQQYPFIRWASTPGVGAGGARNAGLDRARGPLVLWLDADDYLLPAALDGMLRHFVAGGGGYVYTDWYGRHADGRMEAHEAPEYDRDAWLHNGQHAVTVLMATADARALGGFDAEMRGWEDWDFFVKAAIAGICGHRLAAPLLVYRYHTGGRREDSLAHKDELLATLRDRYAAFANGGTAMAPCGSCGDGGAAIMAARQVLEGAPIVAEPITANEEGVVRLEFIGDEWGEITWYGQQGRTYRAGRAPESRYINADPADVERLLAIGKFRVVPGQVLRPPPPAAPAAISPATPEPPTMDAAPLALPVEDALSPEAEAAMNEQIATQVKKQRRASR
jgi:glycosyltransferase involved in cell wall biosynthesis